MRAHEREPTPVSHRLGRCQLQKAQSPTTALPMFELPPAAQGRGDPQRERIDQPITEPN